MEFNYKTELNRYKRYYQSIGGIASKPRVRNYTAVIFSFLAVSLFGWYAIRPTIQTILLLRKEIADNKIVSQRMEDKIAKLIEAQSIYQKIQNQLSVVSQAVPQNPEAIDISTSIQSLIQTTNASLSALSVSSAPLLGNEPTTNPKGQSSIQPNTATPVPKNTQGSNQNFISVPINLTVAGTYSQLFEIIRTLLDFPRIITIDSIHIGKTNESQSPSTSRDNVLQLVLKLNMYYVPK